MIRGGAPQSPGVAREQQWIDTPVKRPGARLRLYCVPYAGGGSTVYRPWANELDERIEVRAVTLPGRERRFVEPALPTIDALADLLVPALTSVLDPPYAIFGHSLGGLLGYEVARRLSERGHPPVHLFASGVRAPHVPDPGPTHHLMPDADLLGAVRGLGGIPPELMEHREFLELMLPTLRADFTAAETYRTEPGRPLPCPIDVFGGAGDPFYHRADLDEWSRYTRAGCAVHVLPGDHFFVTSARAAVLGLVAEALAPYLASGLRR